jgi:hypothetical protein
MQGHVLAPPNPHAKLEAIQTVQPTDPLPVHEPALPPEQHPDALIAEARSRMSQILDAKPQGRLIVGRALSIPGRPTELGEATGPHTTYSRFKLPSFQGETSLLATRYSDSFMISPLLL